MKNLNHLQQSLTKNALIQADQASHIKGGRRYITEKYASVEKKISKLIKEGYTYHVSVHDGKYCIEW